MSDIKITPQILKEMAALSLFSNQINEIQEKNLKMFPLVFFNGVNSAVIEYDLSKVSSVETKENKEEKTISYTIKKPETKHFLISYHLSINEDALNDHLEKRYEALVNSVRNLLWKEIGIKIYFNGKLKHESSYV